MEKYIGKWIRKTQSTNVYYIIGVSDDVIFALVKENIYTSEAYITILQIEMFAGFKIIVIEDKGIGKVDEYNVIDALFTHTLPFM